MTFFLAITIAHTLISLAGIVAGLVVLAGFLQSRAPELWTRLFLAFNVATSVTGYFFPFEKLLPSHLFGVLALVALGFAIAARYHYRLRGKWRTVYVSTSVFALYLNVFVLVAQIFGKVPLFRELAPTQSEPPFLIAQTVVLILFVMLGIASLKRFRVEFPLAAR
jgi:hypothetical protein